MAEIIFQVLGISMGINILFFIFAYIIKSDIFTDITYASTFLIVTIAVMIMNRAYGVTHFVVLACVAAWSIRLGTFLFVRIRRYKVDHRFDKMRGSFVKFGLFWILQGFTVWVVNMPAYFLMSASGPTNLYIIIPAIFALVFLAFETVADIQKYRFNLKNRGKFINIGLWKISRHPNYFGEYMFWWMLFAILMIYSPRWINLIAVLGPLYIMTTLYFISGVPMLEKSGYKRFGKNQSYHSYVKKTPIVIPFFGKKGWTHPVKKIVKKDH